MSKNSQASTSGYTRTAQTVRSRQPLPGRLSRLLMEARWIAMAVAFLSGARVLPLLIRA